MNGAPEGVYEEEKFVKSVTIGHMLTQGHSTLNRTEHPKSDQSKVAWMAKQAKRGGL